MRRASALIVLASFVALFAQAHAYEVTLHDVLAEVHFSPCGGVQDALVQHIEQARESIYVLAYSFTSDPIVEALVRAHQRGVHVEAILDRSQRTAKGSRGHALTASGAMVYVDAKHAIAHNKVMVLDRRTKPVGYRQD